MSSSSKPEGAHPLWVAGAALAILVLIGVLPRIQLSRNPLVGKPAPNFRLQVVHQGEPGARLELASLKGKPVLLDFWATWCGPCRAEAPVLSRLADRYKSRGLIVLGVNTDSPAKAQAFARSRNLHFPIVFDDQDAAEAYRVTNLPTLVLVDKQGNVKAVRIGTVDEGSLEELIADVL